MFVSVNYAHGLIWGLFIILHRLLLWFLIWRIIGGIWLIACILYQLTFYSIICYITKEHIFLENIMGSVLQWVEILIFLISLDMIMSFHCIFF